MLKKILGMIRRTKKRKVDLEIQKERVRRKSEARKDKIDKQKEQLGLLMEKISEKRIKLSQTQSNLLGILSADALRKINLALDGVPKGKGFQLALEACIDYYRKAISGKKPHYTPKKGDLVNQLELHIKYYIHKHREQ